MMSEDNRLIELLLTAEVISLAKQIKAEKARKGIQTTSDCISDAISEIQNKRQIIISSLK